MKKLSIVLLVTTLLLSCAKQKEDTDLIGVWKLTEVSIDPGDGSGTFRNVSSNKTIEFHPDGVITSNGLICSLEIMADIPDSGTYSMADSSISGRTCSGNQKIRIKKEKSAVLLFHPCIEPCQYKYIRQ